MEYKDYYKILGIDKNASPDQIKREYRKKAREYHPDVNKDADSEQRFKEIGEAYEVLKDPEKRKLYDQYGAEWKTGKQQEEFRKKYQQQYRQQSGGQYGGGFGGESEFDFSGAFQGEGEYSDFFEMLFGNRGRRRGTRKSIKRKGEDVRASITIPLKDAFEGATRRINFTMQKMNPDGSVSTTPKSLNIKIPKGIKDGQKIRLAGQGAPGLNGGDQGDMYIEVTIEKSPHLRIEGADVYFDLPVAPWEAVLGNTVNLPAPGGDLKLKIPPGSTHGKKLRLKGKGIPAKNAGDLYVVLNVVLPPANSEKARKVYEQMKELNFNPRNTIGG